MSNTLMWGRLIAAQLAWSTAVVLGSVMFEITSGRTSLDEQLAWFWWGVVVVFGVAIATAPINLGLWWLLRRQRRPSMIVSIVVCSSAYAGLAMVTTSAPDEATIAGAVGFGALAGLLGLVIGLLTRSAPPPR